jgi:GPN-loop GTPase
MEEHSLGPNGALLFCMETLEVNFDWLSDELARFDPNSYFIFDFPGQVELFTNHQSVFNILHKLERELHFRLVALHLVDSTHCKEPFKFISLALLTMQSMMRLECPQINVLSKFDKFDQEIVAEGKEKDFIPLTFYADCVDLSLVCNGEAMGKSKYSQLTQAISELIEDFGLVSFVPVAVEDKECMAFLMQEIDKANGLVFGGLTAGNESILQTSMTTTNRDEYIQSMENKYMRHG